MKIWENLDENSANCLAILEKDYNNTGELIIGEEKVELGEITSVSA